MGSGRIRAVRVTPWAHSKWSSLPPSGLKAQRFEWVSSCFAFTVARDRGALISAEPRINDQIRVAAVRLIGPNSEQIGIVAIAEAIQMAIDADLDLVEIAPEADPPVCKIMDFGKFKYEIAQKARSARKNQTHVLIKEMKMRPKIDTHDYETKKAHIERFLRGGDKVKVTMMFRGREQARPDTGYRLLVKLAEDVVDCATVEFAPKLDGRNMVMVLAPTKRKNEAVAEARAARQAAQNSAENSTQNSPE